MTGENLEPEENEKCLSTQTSQIEKMHLYNVFFLRTQQLEAFNHPWSLPHS